MDYPLLTASSSGVRSGSILLALVGKSAAYADPSSSVCVAVKMVQKIRVAVVTEPVVAHNFVEMQGLCVKPFHLATVAQSDAN